MPPPGAGPIEPDPQPDPGPLPDGGPVEPDLQPDPREGDHGAPEPPPPPSPADTRKQGKEEISIKVPPYGELRYNTTFKFIRAHCDHPEHRELKQICARKRMVKEGPKTGRPIGLLVAWLQAQSHHGHRKAHVDRPKAEFPERQAARDFFMQLPNAAAFSERFEAAGAGEPREIN